MLVIHEDGNGTWFSEGDVYVILAKDWEEESRIYELMADAFDGTLSEEGEKELDMYFDNGKIVRLNREDVRLAIAQYLKVPIKWVPEE